MPALDVLGFRARGAAVLGELPEGVTARVTEREGRGGERE